MGNKIGRYEIIKELGRGAQSIVYLALDPHLQREVAIKTLHFTQSDPQKNKQLLAEARMVSQLRHPNIVPIFEAGEEDGDLYLVFEYVAGRMIGDYLFGDELTVADCYLFVMLRWMTHRPTLALSRDCRANLNRP